MMKYKAIRVGYSELRSSGFNNKKYEICYEAELEDDEDVNTVGKELLEKAITEVKKLHGEVEDGMVVKTYLVPERELPPF